MEHLNHITNEIIRCAIKVHQTLGPGLLESVYETCLEYELLQIGFKVDRQKSLPVIYNSIKLDAGFRIDLLVEDAVLVELKSVRETTPIDEAQLLTYLKLSDKKVGLLINLNVKLLKDGTVRRVM
jgi:GxxExxY protein